MLSGKTPHSPFWEQEEEGHAILLEQQLGRAQESMKTHTLEMTVLAPV